MLTPPKDAQLPGRIPTPIGTVQKGPLSDPSSIEYTTEVHTQADKTLTELARIGRGLANRSPVGKLLGEC